jgi:hypothetical protein
MAQVSPSSGFNLSYSGIPDHVAKEGLLNGSKKCKLCRKERSNEHFYNPKAESLFAVCDICRKGKREKYWRKDFYILFLCTGNKMLLQQEAVEAKQAGKRRQTVRKDTHLSSSFQKYERGVYSDPSSLDYSSSSSASTSQTASPRAYSVSSKHSSTSASSHSSQGELILITPQLHQFLLMYSNNPSYVRACIGDHYWNALCIPKYFSPIFLPYSYQTNMDGRR